jgi:hypothetical protein
MKAESFGVASRQPTLTVRSADGAPSFLPSDERNDGLSLFSTACHFAIYNAIILPISACAAA